MSRILKIILVMFSSLLIFPTIIFSKTLNLEIIVQEDKIKVGDEINIIVNWQQGMQAVDFSLIYDSEKLEYIDADIDEFFINNKNNKVSVCWFSDNNTDKEKIEFKFKAIKTGKVKLNTKIEGGFATGELKKPEEYLEGSKTIKISSNNNLLLPKIMILVLFIIFLILIKIKIQRRKFKNEKINKS